MAAKAADQQLLLHAVAGARGACRLAAHLFASQSEAVPLDNPANHRHPFHLAMLFIVTGRGLSITIGLKMPFGMFTMLYLTTNVVVVSVT
jgi:hypothetical protein